MYTYIHTYIHICRERDSYVYMCIYILYYFDDMAIRMMMTDIVTIAIIRIMTKRLQ